MQDKLKLNDLLQLTDEELSRVRIRLNSYNGKSDPIEEFKKDPENLLYWNYHHNKKYSQNQISIGLVNMGNDRWLLFTVGVITKVLTKEEIKHGLQVEFKTMEKYKDLYGRVVVSYHNKSQQMFRKGDFIDELIIKEILPTTYTGFDFPGYDNVCLSFNQLETIINGNYPSYHNALANQKAVYLQTDKATGKLYVGSATSNNGLLLSRWKSYIQNGHGGNKDLIALIKKEGFEYIKNNFQYAIIENFNAKVDDEYILKRESYWKDVLQSRKFGYNKN